MLAICDEKRSTKPLSQLVASVGKFLELCTVESRVPAHITVRTPDWRQPDPRCGARPLVCQEWIHEYFRAVSDAPVMPYIQQSFHDSAAMTARLAEALRISEVPDLEVSIRWSPQIASSETDVRRPPTPLFYAPRNEGVAEISPVFLSLGQSKANPEPRTIWIMCGLDTPFDEPNAEFLEFLREANRRLPFKFNPRKWRSVTVNAKGRTVSTKVDLSGVV